LYREKRLEIRGKSRSEKIFPGNEFGERKNVSTPLATTLPFYSKRGKKRRRSLHQSKWLSRWKGKTGDRETCQIYLILILKAGGKRGKKGGEEERRHHVLSAVWMLSVAPLQR